MAITQKSWQFILNSALLMGFAFTLCGCQSSSSTSSSSTSNESSLSHIHILSSWHEEEQSTCSVKGHVGYYQCTECLKYLDKNLQEISDIQLDYSDHKYAYHEESESTCITPGMKSHYTCETCDKYFDTNKNECSRSSLEKALSNHDYQVMTRIKPSSANEGKVTYKCLNCGDIFEKSILKCPVISIDSTNSTLSWSNVEHADKYIVYKDGKAIDNGIYTSYGIEAGSNSSTYAVAAFDTNNEYLGGYKSNSITLSYDNNLIDNSSIKEYPLTNSWINGFGNFASTGIVSIVNGENLCAKLKPNNFSSKKAIITKACSYETLKDAGDYILKLKVKKSFTADGTLKFGIYDGIKWKVNDITIDITNAKANEWSEIITPYTLTSDLASYMNLDIVYTCNNYCLDNFVLIDDITITSKDKSKKDTYKGDFENFSSEIYKTNYSLATCENIGDSGKYRISVLANTNSDTSELRINYVGTDEPTSQVFTTTKISKKVKWYDFTYSVLSNLTSSVSLNINATNINIYNIKVNKVTKRDGNLCNLDTYSDQIDSVEYVSMLTGVNAQTESSVTYGVDGTDLGIMYYDSTKEQMRYLFGDTFTNVEPDGTLAGTWRSQTVAISTDMNASDGIEFETYLSNGEIAKELISSKHDKNKGETTKIPTGGIEINGIHYIFYMSISEWLDDTWLVNYCGVAKSSDGINFEKLNNIYFVNTDSASINYTKSDLSISSVDGHINSNFMQVFPYEANGYIYLFGIPQGREGALKVARVIKQSFENMSEYEYFTDNGWIKGNAGISASATSKSTSLSQVSEFNVIYNPYLKKYMMIHLDKSSKGIIYQTSTDLVHWGNKQIILKNADFPTAYGGFTNEHLLENNGKVMYIVISQYAGSPVYEQIGRDHYNSKVMKIIFN